MKISKKNIAKWVAALRSGEYEQASGSLETFKGFCCLGVACKLFIPEDLLQYTERNLLRGKMPNEQECCPEWLEHIANDFGSLTGINLAYLNDAGVTDNPDKPPIYVLGISENLEKLTFDEIADLLQLVFIEEAL